jgi:hypothetical protein
MELPKKGKLTHPKPKKWWAQKFKEMPFHFFNKINLVFEESEMEDIWVKFDIDFVPCDN